MEIIGEKLKTSREENGLSLEEVSEDLKIDIEDLKNLEHGNRKAFTDIYLLKKYIYVYAKYLGLDYEQLIEEFNEFLFEATSKIPVDVIERISRQKEKEETEKKALSPYTISVKEKNKKRNILIIIISIALIIGIVTAMIVLKNNSEQNNDTMISALL